ncbi:MAG: hypothetical protein AAF810_19005 [Cyanobacteria bacterium P01_D01_bin.36]
MANPLKYLPWSVLLQSAAVTIAIATIADYGLLWVVSKWAESQPVLARQVVSSTIFFALLAAAYGIGALALLITERFFREIVLTAETLWALIGCVVLIYWVRTLLISQVPGLLMQVDIYNIVLITLGVFFTGKRYWR